MKEYHYNSVTNLASSAFDKFKASLESLSSQTKIIIALSGGSSVEPLYQQIAKRYNEIPLSLWQKVIFCFADERLVPLDSPDSNYKAACNSFITVLIQAQVIANEAVATVNCDSKTAHLEYTAKVGNKVDIALLGVGPDSHTCSLFPHHSSVDNPSKAFIMVNDSPKPPAARISMSRSMVEHTGSVFVFFIGEGKRDAYNNFMDDTLAIQDAPIKISRQAAQCLVFSDIL
ncbi:6-phosphogluconolactonase [Psychromonas antarctica]|uniref:6-phosphogluconolactonase n=1 Tax=Psychromonas antarctica TaxID=67573 RepID=UPI001EE96064|nr:6-phosphogluconolactonase [Psychromonas antarctica]MCG6201290.1 6-phosphogluconolactonase [Psychromonas antarctica]